jgi:hypothetical protein
MAPSSRASASSGAFSPRNTAYRLHEFRPEHDGLVDAAILLLKKNGYNGDALVESSGIPFQTGAGALASTLRVQPLAADVAQTGHRADEDIEVHTVVPTPFSHAPIDRITR